MAAPTTSRFFPRVPVPAHHESGPIGTLEIWLHHYDDRWRPRDMSPLPLPIGGSSDPEVWEPFHEALLESGLLDIEVVVPGTYSVPEGNHLVVAIGRRFSPAHVTGALSRSSCIVLDRCIVRGRCVWRARRGDADATGEAEGFLGTQWRPADTWANLVVGQVHSNWKNKSWGVREVAPVLIKGEPGAVVQWPLRLGYAKKWQAETFRDVALDLLGLVVPRQEEGFASSGLDLDAALGAGVDLHAVLYAYRIAYDAREFNRRARAFFRQHRIHPPLRPALMSVARDQAPDYWAKNGHVRPLHIVGATRVGRHRLPTTFVAVRDHPLDPDVLVAIASGHRVLGHMDDALGRLRTVRERELEVDGVDDAARRFVEAPRAELAAQQEALRKELRRVDADGTYARPSAPLEKMAASSPQVAALRRFALKLAYDLHKGDRRFAALHLEATNKVYEQWCFLRVALALQGLGFRLRVTGEAPDPAVLYYASAGASWEFEHDVRLGGGGTVTLHKEPTYTAFHKTKRVSSYYGLENRYVEGLTDAPRRAHECTPDIVLEFKGCPAPVRIPPGCPQLVVLDVSSSDREERWCEKYKYSDWIRAYAGRSIGNRLTILRDPDTGESPRIVRAAWSLCPGHKTDEDAPDPCGAHYAMADAPSDQRYRHGYYVLTAREAPDAYHPLQTWLNGLLTGLGLLAPLDVVG